MKRVRYARISLTPLCPLRCRYCVGEDEVPGKGAGRILTYKEILILIDILKEEGVEKFRFTGGEPFLRKGVMDFFRSVTLQNWGVTTSLAVEGIAEEINNSPVNNINVSLDTLDPEKYSWITRGGSLETVLDNLEMLENKNVKLNTILMEGFNSSEAEDIMNFAYGRGFIPRFIEKMDFSFNSQGGGLKSARVNRIKKRLIQKGVLREFPWRKDNSAALYYESASGSGPVGFITPLSEPFCTSCDRIRITAEGGLKSCLFSPPRAFIAESLAAGREEAEKAIKKFIFLKTPCRQEPKGKIRMSSVGG